MHTKTMLYLDIKKIEDDQFDKLIGKSTEPVDTVDQAKLTEEHIMPNLTPEDD